MEIKNLDFDIVTEIRNANANVSAALQVIKVNRDKISDLEKQIFSYRKTVQAYVDKILSPLLWEVERHFNFITQDGRTLDAYKHMYFGTILSVNQKQTPYKPTGEYLYYIGAADSAGTYATYKNLDTFKLVINELAETIRNGGNEYKFPADKEA